jgi:hypothetical protein
MKDQRGDRAAIFYIQAVLGENLYAKPLWTKTRRKPGQIKSCACRKEKNRKEKYRTPIVAKKAKESKDIHATKNIHVHQ